VFFILTRVIKFTRVKNIYARDLKKYKVCLKNEMFIFFTRVKPVFYKQSHLKNGTIKEEVAYSDNKQRKQSDIQTEMYN
jgi:hypothetical protein